MSRGSRQIGAYLEAEHSGQTAMTQFLAVFAAAGSFGLVAYSVLLGFANLTA